MRNWQRLIATGVLLALLGIGAAWTMEPSLPQFREKESPRPVKMHKKIPWLPVILGVGAGVVLVILLTRKKTRTLTANLHVGTSGTPAATAKYKKGTVVPYHFTTKAGFQDVQVRLDGAMAPASGSVTMDRDHTLAARTTNDSATFSNGALIVNGIRYEMELIPAGEFQMGSDSSEANHDEQPVHTVLISKPFWLGKTEVTQPLWQAVMGSNPSKFQSGDSYPVERTQWEWCQDFVSSLNQMLGSSFFRLPTEAEWEYACRAGTTEDRYGELDAIAWYSANSGGSTRPVGLKQANHFGLYDMLGNVWEWCQDIYDFPYPSGYQVDPLMTGEFNSRSGRVYRGGSWESVAKAVRSPQRDRDHPNERRPLVSVGLRLARTNG